MSKNSKILYHDDEGRRHLTTTIRSVKQYLKNLQNHNREYPRTVVFLTSQGEGPMLAYNELSAFNVQMIAVTFSPAFRVRLDREVVQIEMPPKVRQFFDGVGIKVITSRLPFEGGPSPSSKAEVEVIKEALALLGGGFPLAVQCVLQACDHGMVRTGEKVIAITGDCALVIVASSTNEIFDRHYGMSIEEIICKPKKLTIQRLQEVRRDTEMSGVVSLNSTVIEGGK